MKKHEIIISKNQIEKEIERIAKQINNDYKNKEIVFLVVMTGGLYFALDLAKKIDVPIAFNFLHIKSYKNNVKTSFYETKFINNVEYKNKEVIIVEDIIETGQTIQNVYDLIKTKKPKSISLAVLFSPVIIKHIKTYIAFSNRPEGFLVGYGLDDNEFDRNHDYIAIIKR